MQDIFQSAPPHPNIWPYLSTRWTGQTLDRIVTHPKWFDNIHQLHCPDTFILMASTRQTVNFCFSAKYLLLFSRHISTKTVKMALRGWQGEYNPSRHTPYPHSRNFPQSRTTRSFRKIKRRILQELKTNFKKKAIRNLSSHQLSTIETEVIGLTLNFFPTPSSPKL